MVKTMSARDSASFSASTSRSTLSPTDWRCVCVMPNGASICPSSAELLSTICPRRISVPTATISALIPPLWRIVMVVRATRIAVR